MKVFDTIDLVFTSLNLYCFLQICDDASLNVRVVMAIEQNALVIETNSYCLFRRKQFRMSEDKLSVENKLKSKFDSIIQSKTKDVLLSTLEVMKSYLSESKLSNDSSIEKVETRNSKCLEMLSSIFNEFYDCDDFNHDDLKYWKLVDLAYTVYQMNVESKEQFICYKNSCDSNPEMSVKTLHKSSNNNFDVLNFKTRFKLLQKHSNDETYSSSDLTNCYDNSKYENCLSQWIHSYDLCSLDTRDLKMIFINTIEELNSMLTSLRQSSLLLISIFIDKINSYDGIPTQITISNLHSIYVINIAKLFIKFRSIIEIIESPDIIKIFFTDMNDMKMLSYLTNNLFQKSSLIMNITDFIDCFLDNTFVNNLLKLANRFDRNFHFDVSKCFHDDSFDFMKHLLDLNPNLNYFRDICQQINIFFGSHDPSNKTAKSFSITKFKSALDNYFSSNEFKSDYYNDFGIEKLIGQIFTQDPDKRTIQIKLIVAINKIRKSSARIKDISPLSILPNYFLFKIANILPNERSKLVACCIPMPIDLDQELFDQILDECCKSYLQLSQLKSKNHSSKQNINFKRNENQDTKESIIHNVAFPQAKLHKLATSSSNLSIFPQFKFLKDKTQSSNNILLKGHNFKPLLPTEELVANILPQLQYYLPKTSELYKTLEKNRIVNMNRNGLDYSNIPRIRIFNYSTESNAINSKQSNLNPSQRSVDIEKSLKKTKKAKSARNTSISNTPSKNSSDFNYESSSKELYENIGELQTQLRNDQQRSSNSRGPNRTSKANGIKAKLKNRIKKMVKK